MAKWLSISLLAAIAVCTVIKLFNLTDLDIIRIQTRRQYYPKIISRLFQNKLTESFTLARKHVFSFFKI